MTLAVARDVKPNTVCDSYRYFKLSFDATSTSVFNQSKHIEMYIGHQQKNNNCVQHKFIDSSSEKRLVQMECIQSQT